jgi:hypothetical protein
LLGVGALSARLGTKASPSLFSLSMQLAVKASRQSWSIRATPFDSLVPSFRPSLPGTPAERLLMWQYRVEGRPVPIPGRPPADSR